MASYVVAALLFAGHAHSAPRADAANDPCFRCTLVIGYSQVGQLSPQGGGWFVAGGEFEKAVGSDRWQLLWQGGAGVDRWRNPDYPGWNRPITSPVPVDPSKPDRVLLSISGPYGSDERAWAEAIEATVETIKVKYPTTRQIWLQPVVGGPEGVGSAPGGRRVRAARQHAHILNAIREVVRRQGGGAVRVVEGAVPRVRSMADYTDGLGHLTHDAAAVIGRALGEYYAQRDEACRQAGHVACGRK